MGSERKRESPLAGARGSSAGVLALALVALSACRSQPTPIADEGDAALPSYAEVYAKAEERVGALERFWAIAVVGLRYRDAEGEAHREQGEGHLQVVRPSHVALTIGKLGETYLLLGCDAERFWWIERLETRRAYVGGQEGARNLALERVGVPVLPTDVLVLADMVAWPAPESDDAGRVVRADGPGLFAVEFAEAGRLRRVTLTRRVFDPVGVELFAEDGRLVARSELSQHQRVDNRIEPLLAQRVPARINIDVPSAESRIELNLSRMEISERRPKALVFDLDELIERLGIEEVIRLEEVRPVASGAGR